MPGSLAWPSIVPAQRCAWNGSWNGAAGIPALPVLSVRFPVQSVLTCPTSTSCSPGTQMSSAPVGVKGLGEIGVVGVSAAIANAVYHATGRGVCSLPITIDRLLARGA